MAISKLRIKVGDVELDFEGSEEFLKSDLPALLRSTLELRPVSEKARKPARGENGQAEEDNVDLQLTTGAIAAKRQAASLSDLLEAAAAHLALVQKKKTFSRTELLSAMQTATHYYKKNYSGNLSKSLKRALSPSGFLSEPATDTYTLTPSARTRLEKELADSGAA